jgi:hypothetical protein
VEVRTSNTAGGEAKANEKLDRTRQWAAKWGVEFGGVKTWESAQLGIHRGNFGLRHIGSLPSSPQPLERVVATSSSGPVFSQLHIVQLHSGIMKTLSQPEPYHYHARGWTN